MINDDQDDDDGDSSDHKNLANNENESSHDVELVPRTVEKAGGFVWAKARRQEKLKQRLHDIEIRDAERRGEARAHHRVEQLGKWTVGVALAMATLMVASAALAWNARHVIKRAAVAAWGGDGRPERTERAAKRAPVVPPAAETTTPQVYTVRSVHDTVCRIAGSTRAANVLIVRYRIPLRYMKDGTVVAVVHLGQRFARPLPHEVVSEHWINCGERP